MRCEIRFFSPTWRMFRASKLGPRFVVCFVYRLFGTLSENEYRNTPQKKSKKVSNSNRDPSNFSELLGPTKEPSNRIPKSCPTLWLQRSFVEMFVFARLSFWFAAKERNIAWMKNWLPNKSHSLPIHARDYSKHYDPPRLTNKLDHLGWNFGSFTEKFLFPWGRSLPWNKPLIFPGPFAVSCRVVLWIIEAFQWLYLFFVLADQREMILGRMRMIRTWSACDRLEDFCLYLHDPHEKCEDTCIKIFFRSIFPTSPQFCSTPNL